MSGPAQFWNIGRSGEIARTVAVVGGTVLCLSLFGILTRPIGLFAAFWPVNAVLLGLFIRRPDYASAIGWTAAALAFALSGVVTGDPVETNVWLTTANMVSVAVGYVLFHRLAPADQHLRRPLSMLHLLWICAVASCAAAAFGSNLASALFNRPWFDAFAFWFATELGNYMAVLPVLLAMPDSLYSRIPRLDWNRSLRAARSAIADAANAAPLAALVLSIAVSAIVGGPGAIAFSVPALLWCSVSFTLLPVSLVVLLFSIVMMIGESTRVLALPETYDYLDATTSFRLGITSLALGPLTVTIIITLQKELLRRLDQAVTHDSLTGILARRAFFDLTAERLAPAHCKSPSGLALLMIDIDHFKQFNDRYGHATGDAALVSVTSAIQRELRETDLFGRIGGEEFAVALFNVTPEHALTTAERLRSAVEQSSFATKSEPPLKATISIGVFYSPSLPSTGLMELLPLADAALYRAKSEGRNRVVLFGEADSAPKLPALATTG